MELTKDDTKMIQGLAVMAMVWLHLFDRSYEGLFQPVLFLFDIPLSFYIAQLCDFCVMGFAFCSGYAHYHISVEKDYFNTRIKSLLKLLIRYWVVLAVFLVISVLMGKTDFMPGSWTTLILSILTWSNAYNGAWWYLFIYILLVLMSPWIQKLVRKHSSAIILVVGFVIYFLSYLIRFKVTFSNAILLKLALLGMTLFEYLMGSVAAKTQYFTKMSDFFNRFSTLTRFVISLIVLIVMLLGHTLVIPSLFIAPVTGLAIMTIFHLWKKPDAVRNVFLFVGKHSTHIWLMHMFFFWDPFNGMAYKAVYPVFIFGLLIGITVVVSVILTYAENIIYRAVKLV